LFVPIDHWTCGAHLLVMQSYSSLTWAQLRERVLGVIKSIMSRNVNFDRAVLPLEGLISGLLTCVLPVVLNVLGLNPIAFTGAIFGAVVSAHFWWFRGIRSGWRVLGFVAISTAAYPIAVNATITNPIRLASLNFSGNGAGDIDSSQFLTGGILGAATLFTGFFFFLAPFTRWPRFLAKAFCFTVIGGFLGVFGWALGGFLSVSLRGVQNQSNDWNFYSLYVVWQAGIALLLGLLLPAQDVSADRSVAEPVRSRQSEAASPGLSPTAKALLVLVVVGLSLFMTRMVIVERGAHRYLARERAARAQRPSLENLPAIETLPPEEVLVLKAINAHPCGSVVNRGTPTNGITVEGGGGVFPYVAYGVSYKRSEYAQDFEAPFVSVSVMLYPNSDWARYEMKEIPTRNLAAMNPAITTVTKYGNKILMNTTMRNPDGVGDLYFSWVSGNRLVVVTFSDTEDDES
jgi:hypothetical protein